VDVMTLPYVLLKHAVKAGTRARFKWYLVVPRWLTRIATDWQGFARLAPKCATLWNRSRSPLEQES